jgi:ribosomal protein S18 acetylase RimI-like enzyme
MLDRRLRRGENMNTLNIQYKEITKDELSIYDSIPMIVNIESIYKIQKNDGGIKSIDFIETKTLPYTKDFAKYQIISELYKEFDLTNWAFFVAFINDVPIGGACIVYNTNNVSMLDGRKDISVLWDIRVNGKYQNFGIGTELMKMCIHWSRERKLKYIKIESQNNNVKACNFYRKLGANIGSINEFAYWFDEDIKNEVQINWYLDL